MKNFHLLIAKCAFLVMLMILVSCGKKSTAVAPQEPDKGKPEVKATAVNDTLLNVTYENGTSSSGITGVAATHATAAEAAFMVSPGASGNYAIAHKIVHGDNGYYSDGNWRSESDAIALQNARFFPGDERRYEFSVYLKDWTLNPSDATETNLFQLKLSAGEVPLQIRTTRNAMVLRFAIANSQPNVSVISNMQQYVNKWIHFRVDVGWQTTATGYMKTYMKLPGESDYTLKDNKTNYLTYNSSGASGQIGYIKWGLYIIPANSTRIAYHDDIRIIKLPLK